MKGTQSPTNVSTKLQRIAELARRHPKEALTASTSPIGAGEFTCRSCFLVKRRAQLADEKLQLCLDCA
jgi:hypothetical protein